MVLEIASGAAQNRDEVATAASARRAGERWSEFNQLPELNNTSARTGRSLWAALVAEKRVMLHAIAFFSGVGRQREIRPHRSDADLPPWTLSLKWKAMRSSSKAMSSLRAATIEARAAQGARSEFVASADENAAYWEQGDVTLHTRELWDLRMALHTHPDVVAELHRWWIMLVRTFHESARPQVGRVPKPTPVWAGLTGRDYTKLQLRLYKALIEPFDMRDAKACAKLDWHSDRHGEPTMGRLAVYDSLFQLTDLWSAPLLSAPA